MDKKQIKKNKDLNILFGQPPQRELKLSYSRVSDFDRNGPKCLIKRTFVENDGAKIGSLTDDLLYSKLVDKNYFKNNYYLYDSDKPTASTLKLCNIITENYNEYPSSNEILKIIQKNGLWSSSTKEDVLISKFETKQFKDYLTAYFESKTKTIVSTSEYLLAEDLVNTLFTHEYSKNTFDNSHDNIYQFPIKFTFNEFIFRGIIDIIRINHKNKTVKFIDLKTGKEDSKDFSKSFLKWRYDLQACVYREGFNEFCKELGLQDYKLLPFEFLYISRFEKIPLTYKITEKWQQASLHGFVTINGWKYRGLLELTNEIKWHWDNKIFDKNRNIYESNGLLMLDDDFINLK